MPLPLALIGTAWGWSPGELRPLDPGPATAIVGSPSWDGAPALFVVGADGLRVVDPATGATLASTSERPAQVLVQDLDAIGEPEVVTCSAAGIHLLRGHRGGLAAPRPLTDVPCGAVVAELHVDWPRLVSAGGGALTRWEPTSLGLDRVDFLLVAPVEPLRLAASGAGVATVLAGDVRWTSDEEVGGSPGPIVAVAGLPPVDGAPAFVWLVGGERPRILHPAGELDLPRPGAGLVSSGSDLWVLDTGEARVGTVTGAGVAWWLSPVVPRLATAFDADGDGCVDLVLADGESAGALVLGVCGSEAGTAVAAPAPARPVPLADRVIVPAAPAELPIGDRWLVVDVRVGEVLRTKLVNGTDGRWRSRDGPPGFAVQSDGVIQWEPEAAEVGRWRVSVRASSPDRLSPRWTGLEVRVWPAESTIAGAAVEPREVALPEYPHKPSVLEALAPRAVLVGLGAAGGAADAGGTTWQNLGGPRTRGSVSPMASLVGTWGSPAVQLVAGVDTAPFFSYGAQPEDRRHAVATMLGGQLGAAGAYVGLYGTLGYTIRGVGMRMQWTGLKDWRGNPMGLEARGLWLAPQAGAGGSLAWVWTL